jgi:hypothetical protein
MIDTDSIPQAMQELEKVHRSIKWAEHLISSLTDTDEGFEKFEGFEELTIKNLSKIRQLVRTQFESMQREYLENVEHCEDLTQDEWSLPE